MTITSSNSHATTEWLAPGRAPGCRCEQPMRDHDSCVRCGHWIQPTVEELPRPRRSSLADNRWTAAGVVRAVRTFEFFLDRLPTTTDWSVEDDAQWPGARTVVRLFGSFEAGSRAARLSPVGRAGRSPTPRGSCSSSPAPVR